MRIPFYSSSASNYKEGVSGGDWLPLFGMDHWFNKMEMGYPYEECWGVEELKEIRGNNEKLDT